MRYLRNNKGLNISGSNQKRKLMNIGYYHGYKGYRYIRKPSNQIPYSSFEELSAIYDFDAQLKSIFYPVVMMIETAFKNYVLETICEKAKSDNFNDIYNKLLNNHLQYSSQTPTTSSQRKNNEEQYKNAMKKRMELRNRIYTIQTNAYQNGNKIADHYLRNDRNLPIWAIFELLSLGEFGRFISCLNKDTRAAISLKLGIRKNDDTNSLLPERLIYATKDLRNSIAHNDVIFDTRFSKSNINGQVKNAISNATGISDITFETISDYLILLIYQMKLIHCNKRDMYNLITSFEKTVNELRDKIPTTIFSQIIYTNYRNKIEKLKHFIKLK